MQTFKYLLEKVVNQDRMDAAKSKLGQSRQHGVFISPSEHAQARAHQRRGHDMEAHHWDGMMGNVVKHLHGKEPGHYLVYSNKHKQGVVVHHKPHLNRLVVTTVLPKGRSTPKDGTKVSVMESMVLEHNIIIMEDENYI